MCRPLSPFLPLDSPEFVPKRKPVKHRDPNAPVGNVIRWDAPDTYAITFDDGLVELNPKPSRPARKKASKNNANASREGKRERPPVVPVSRPSGGDVALAVLSFSGGRHQGPVKAQPVFCCKGPLQWTEDQARRGEQPAGQRARHRVADRRPARGNAKRIVAGNCWERRSIDFGNGASRTRTRFDFCSG